MRRSRSFDEGLSLAARHEWHQMKDERDRSIQLGQDLVGRVKEMAAEQERLAHENSLLQSALKDDMLLSKCTELERTKKDLEGRLNMTKRTENLQQTETIYLLHELQERSMVIEDLQSQVDELKAKDGKAKCFSPEASRPEVCTFGTQTRTSQIIDYSDFDLTMPLYETQTQTSPPRPSDEATSQGNTKHTMACGTDDIEYYEEPSVCDARYSILADELKEEDTNPVEQPDISMIETPSVLESSCVTDTTTPIKIGFENMMRILEEANTEPPSLETPRGQHENLFSQSPRCAHVAEERMRSRKIRALQREQARAADELQQEGDEHQAYLDDKEDKEEAYLLTAVKEAMQVRRESRIQQQQMKRKEWEEQVLQLKVRAAQRQREEEEQESIRQQEDQQDRERKDNMVREVEREKEREDERDADCDRLVELDAEEKEDAQAIAELDTQDEEERAMLEERAKHRTLERERLAEREVRRQEDERMVKQGLETENMLDMQRAQRHERQAASSHNRKLEQERDEKLMQRLVKADSLAKLADARMLEIENEEFATAERRWREKREARLEREEVRKQRQRLREERQGQREEEEAADAAEAAKEELERAADEETEQILSPCSPRQWSSPQWREHPSLATELATPVEEPPSASKFIPIAAFHSPPSAKPKPSAAFHSPSSAKPQTTAAFRSPPSGKLSPSVVATFLSAPCTSSPSSTATPSPRHSVALSPSSAAMSSPTLATSSPKSSGLSPKTSTYHSPTTSTPKSGSPRYSPAAAMARTPTMSDLKARKPSSPPTSTPLKSSFDAVSSVLKPSSTVPASALKRTTEQDSSRGTILKAPSILRSSTSSTSPTQPEDTSMNGGTSKASGGREARRVRFSAEVFLRDEGHLMLPTTGPIPTEPPAEDPGALSPVSPRRPALVLTGCSGAFANRVPMSVSHTTTPGFASQSSPRQSTPRLSTSQAYQRRASASVIRAPASGSKAGLGLRRKMSAPTITRNRSTSIAQQQEPGHLTPMGWDEKGSVPVQVKEKSLARDDISIRSSEAFHAWRRDGNSQVLKRRSSALSKKMMGGSEARSSTPRTSALAQHLKAMNSSQNLTPRQGIVAKGNISPSASICTSEASTPRSVASTCSSVQSVNGSRSRRQPPHATIMASTVSYTKNRKRASSPLEGQLAKDAMATMTKPFPFIPKLNINGNAGDSPTMMRISPSKISPSISPSKAVDLDTIELAPPEAETCTFLDVPTPAKWRESLSPNRRVSGQRGSPSPGHLVPSQSYSPSKRATPDSQGECTPGPSPSPTFEIGTDCGYTVLDDVTMLSPPKEPEEPKIHPVEVASASHQTPDRRVKPSALKTALERAMQAGEGSFLTIDSRLKDCDGGINELRAEVMVCTQYMSLIISKIHMSRDKERVFKNAHNHVKTVVVELAGKDTKFVPGHEWPLKPESIVRLPDYHRTAVVRSLQEMIISYDMMPTIKRSTMVTVMEVLNNTHWLIAMARFCYSAGRIPVARTQKRGNDFQYDPKDDSFSTPFNSKKSARSRSTSMTS